MDGDNEPQTPTTSKARYSLRTRTPVKPEPLPASPAFTTPRKRGRPSFATLPSNKLPLIPGTPARGRGRGRGRGQGRGRGRLTAARTGSDGDESEVGVTPDAAEMSSEDEEYAPVDGEPLSLGARRGGADLAPLIVDGTVRTGRRGRPRKSVGVAGTIPGRGMRDLEDRVGDLALATPARRSWEVRRIPVHLTKHDAFRTEHLDDATRVMMTVPVNDVEGDRYEMKKLSDAIKMCGYEMHSTSVAMDEIYRLLAWSVYAPHEGGVVPEVGEEARGLLLRVFAEVGRRVREETKDLASYHRRHVLRKLLLADAVSPPEESNDVDEEKSPRGEHSVHRRNPLRVPGPLVDIWKMPPSPKKADVTGGHESDA
ncbi:hypothetical protein H4218_005875 [Coemansia sp. IMI 209128]|nr:hypothetical protein H4218_005875 [Coemansia sp. IMI 209128]